MIDFEVVRSICHTDRAIASGAYLLKKISEKKKCNSQSKNRLYNTDEYLDIIEIGAREYGKPSASGEKPVDIAADVPNELIRKSVHTSAFGIYACVMRVRVYNILWKEEGITASKKGNKKSENQ